MTNPLLDSFDRVYVINLPHRSDRRAQISLQLGKVGLSVDRAPVTLFPAIRPADPGDFPNVGARGCFLSHLHVLRDAARAGHGRIAILEDDLDFTPAFDLAGSAVARAVATVPWDVFYGGHRIVGELAAAAQPSWGTDRSVREVPPEVPIVTAHFIAFAGPTIAAVASYLDAMLSRPAGDPQGGPMHVDGAYSWFRAAHPKVRTFVSVEQLGTQRASRTDIHALKWFDSLPLVRDLAQFARRLKRRR